MVPRSDCMLHRRAVRGDIVTFTHDFTLRRVTQDYLERREPHDTEAQHPHADTQDAQAQPSYAHTQDTETLDSELQHAHAHAHTQDAGKMDLPTGTPSHPIVYRIREDLSWGDVVRNSPPSPIRHFVNGLFSPPSPPLLLIQTHLFKQSNIKEWKTT